MWAAVAVIVTVGLTAFLVHLSEGADPQRLAGLLDIVRIGLTVGAGTGGLFALWLATRRQRSAEQTLALQREVSQTTVVDSTERRITEQYNAAVEQLGHEKAAVRLGAIYSLERLAQEHVGHRQTVIDVLCSYLRLPYEPPADREKRATSGTKLSAEAAEAFAELEVRYTIQHMFWEHLGDPEQRHVGEKRWPDIDLDLSRATLIDPILRQLSLRELKCEDMVVHGTADFRGLRVTNISAITARFHGEAIFSDAVFAAGLNLLSCVFEAEVDLSRIAVQTIFILSNCRFSGEVDLSDHSLTTLCANNCHFAHDLVLRDGTCTAVMVFKSEFRGKIATDGLDASTGVVSGCSFQSPPEPHAKIIFTDDMRDRDIFLRDIIAHYGLQFDLEC